jgi:hypothetical protein
MAAGGIEGIMPDNAAKVVSQAKQLSAPSGK